MTHSEAFEILMSISVNISRDDKEDARRFLEDELANAVREHPDQAAQIHPGAAPNGNKYRWCEEIYQDYACPYCGTQWTERR